MQRTAIYSLIATLLYSSVTLADDNNNDLQHHVFSYSQLIMSTCSSPVTQEDRDQDAFVKVSLALANAQEMDREFQLTPSLLEQMHRLLPRYIDCDSPAKTSLEPIVDGFISFLAVNRQLPTLERRAYIKYAKKLSELDGQE
ncbi:hypothetical protein L4D06_02300 [Enterovibrio makurazakiensis]|uniref:hypothetical protein n=1 Tax=Enterovibrio makurazakiensis TaxID=2910232 RepID=UPI003D1D5EF8